MDREIRTSFLNHINPGIFFFFVAKIVDTYKHHFLNLLTVNSSAYTNKDPKEESLKMFLLSMRPDLLKMSDKEVRLFMRKSLQVVDDILSNHLVFTPSHSLSSPSTMPSTDSQMLFISQNENLCEASQFNTFQTRT